VLATWRAQVLGGLTER
jgi:hypothetical protein